MKLTIILAVHASTNQLKQHFYIPMNVSLPPLEGNVYSEEAYPLTTAFNGIMLAEFIPQVTGIARAMLSCLMLATA